MFLVLLLRLLLLLPLLRPMATVGGQTPSDQLVNHAVRYLYAHEQDCGDQFADPLWLPAVDRCDQSCDPLRTICLEHTGEHKIQVCRPLPQSCVEGLLRQFSSVDDAPANVDRDESAQQHSFSTMNNHEQISRLVEEKMVQQATPNRTTDTRLAAVVMKVSSNDDLPPPPPPPPLKLAASGTPLYSNMPTKSDLYFQQLAPFEATIDDEEALATKEQFGSVRYRPRSRFITAPEPLARLKGPPKAVIFKPTVIKKQRRPPPPPESAHDFLKFKGQSRLRAGRKGKGGGVSPKDRFRQATVSPTYRSPVNDNEVFYRFAKEEKHYLQAHGQVNRPASAKSTRVRPQNILPDTNWESGEEITHLMHSLMEENRQNRQGVVENTVADGSPLCCQWALHGLCDRAWQRVRPLCVKSCGALICSSVEGTPTCTRLIDVDVVDCFHRRARALEPALRFAACTLVDALEAHRVDGATGPVWPYGQPVKLRHGGISFL